MIAIDVGDGVAVLVLRRQDVATEQRAAEPSCRAADSYDDNDSPALEHRKPRGL